MADSFIGFMGNALTSLTPMLEHGFGRLARANPAAMTPEAAVFYEGGRFSAVRTLSPKSAALIALSELPIEVPYHSIIGQRHPGPRQRGSDGVVPYPSSHLSGAQSEVIVHSGHNVLSNPDAIRETIRILHLEARTRHPSTWRSHGPFMPPEKFAPGEATTWIRFRRGLRDEGQPVVNGHAPSPQGVGPHRPSGPGLRDRPSMKSDPSLRRPPFEQAFLTR